MSVKDTVKPVDETAAFAPIVTIEKMPRERMKPIFQPGQAEANLNRDAA
jgi:hypothetical protein